MEPQPTDYITGEQLEELKERLTMLDIYRARKSSVDAANRGLAAYHEAAKRIGLVEPKTTLEAFLVRIRAEDFNRIMAEASTDPNPPSSGGENEPSSSAGTDTDQETSSS